jgi:hypothetical protein
VLTSERELNLRPAAHGPSAATGAHFAKQAREGILPAKHLCKDRLGLIAREGGAGPARNAGPVKALLANLVVHVALLDVGEHLVSFRNLKGENAE